MNGIRIIFSLKPVWQHYATTLPYLESSVDFTGTVHVHSLIDQDLIPWCKTSRARDNSCTKN